MVAFSFFFFQKNDYELKKRHLLTLASEKENYKVLSNVFFSNYFHSDFRVTPTYSHQSFPYQWVHPSMSWTCYEAVILVSFQLSLIVL